MTLEKSASAPSHNTAIKTMLGKGKGSSTQGMSDQRLRSSLCLCEVTPVSNIIFHMDRRVNSRLFKLTIDGAGRGRASKSVACQVVC